MSLLRDCLRLEESLRPALEARVLTPDERREAAARIREISRRIGIEPPAEWESSPTLIKLREDPANLMRLAGMEPDPWQENLLRSSSDRILMLCSRQTGKTQLAAALALRTALLKPRSLTLILSPTQRQSSELFRDKFRPLYNDLGRPVPPARPQDNVLSLELANGSRVIALPGDEANIRGYSGVSLLIIDEASRVPDALYYSVRPMLAVSRGTLVVLSTPWGKRGWFYEEWEGKGREDSWHRVRITAHDCPRMDPAFLEEERASLGERWFAQEFLCSFEDMVGAVFAEEDIRQAATDAPPPLWS